MLIYCICTQFLVGALSWQFLAHSHQARDKCTFSLLKGFILCREGQQSTETHVSVECEQRGRAASPSYIFTDKVTGLQSFTVLFLTWHTRKGFALHTHKNSIK